MIVGGARFVRAMSLNSDMEAADKRMVTVRTALEGLATAGEVTTYEPIMEQIGLKTRNPAHRKLIGKILGDITRESHAEHGITLSVLVHRKTGAGRSTPGPGYFVIMEQMGLLGPDDDKVAFAEEQLRLVFVHYSSKSSRKG